MACTSTRQGRHSKQGASRPGSPSGPREPHTRTGRAHTPPALVCRCGRWLSGGRPELTRQPAEAAARGAEGPARGRLFREAASLGAPQGPRRGQTCGPLPPARAAPHLWVGQESWAGGTEYWGAPHCPHPFSVPGGGRAAGNPRRESSGGWKGRQQLPRTEADRPGPAPHRQPAGGPPHASWGGPRTSVCSTSDNPGSLGPQAAADGQRPPGPQALSWGTRPGTPKARLWPSLRATAGGAADVNYETNRWAPVGGLGSNTPAPGCSAGLCSRSPTAALCLPESREARECARGLTGAAQPAWA